MKYEVRVDGQRKAQVASAEELRSWLAAYRDEHAEDDPGAVHVVVRELTRFAWLTGGRLVDREEFLDA